MMGPTHRLAGFLSGEVVALLTHQSWAMVPISGLVASASAHGWASPDIDQTAPWVAVRKRLPAPLAKVLNHRELAHWWGIPGLAAVASLQLAPDVRWLVTLLIAGWVSHLLGDLPFGRLPLWPAGPHIGLDLDTGGFLETGRVKLPRRARRLGRSSIRLLPFSPVRVVLCAAIGFVLFVAY